MTKKIIALLLALIMLFSLAACGSGDEDEKDEDEKVEENDEKDEKDEDEDEDEDKDEDKDEDEDKDDLDISGKYELHESKIKKAELYSDDIVDITVTNLEFVEGWGVEMDFDVTNNSEEKLEFSTAIFAINGFEMGYGYAVCEPGATEQLDVLFSLSEFEAFDIRYIKDIEVIFEAMNMDFETVGVTDLIKFSTDAPESYVQNRDLGGELVLEGDDFKLYYMGCTSFKSYDGGEYLYVNFYLDHTGKANKCEINFATMLINGYSFSEDAYLGACFSGYGVFEQAIFTPEELEEHEIDIDNIESLEFSFEIYDYETSEEVPVDSEPVIIEDVEVVEEEM